jgi:hypothetical protein
MGLERLDMVTPEQMALLKGSPPILATHRRELGNFRVEYMKVLIPQGLQRSLLRATRRRKNT